jgi:hypothetical protein
MHVNNLYFSNPSLNPSLHYGGGLIFGLGILMPTVNYFFYFLSILFFLGFLVYEFPPTYRRILTYCSLVVFFIAISLPKLMLYMSFSDVKEFAKIILILTLCILVKVNLDKKSMGSVIVFVVVTDFLFSVFQWLKFDYPFLEFAQSLLHPEHHIEGSLSLSSVRALGVFADPAEHASIILICYAFFLSRLRYRLSPYQSAFGALLSAILLVLIQSKTGIIALFLSIPLGLYCAAQSFSRFSLIVLTSSLVSICFSLIFLVGLESIEQLYYLFEYGLQLSSFQERTQIWAHVIAISLDANPFLIIFGAGRGALESAGMQSSVFDNDFVYLFNAYGFLGVSFFLVVFFLVVKASKKVHTPSASWLLYVCLFIPVMGAATDFISSLKVLVLIGLIFSSAINGNFKMVRP